jgi:hypothetical protein
MTRRGIQIAKIGKNAESSQILDKLLDERFPLLKAYKQGVASVNVTAAGTYTVDIVHGLGYVPMFVYFVAPDPNDPSKKFFGSSAANGPGSLIANEAYATKEILRLAWQNTGAGFVSYPYKVSFYYYIFYDKLE